MRTEISCALLHESKSQVITALIFKLPFFRVYYSFSRLYYSFSRVYFSFSRVYFSFSRVYFSFSRVYYSFFRVYFSFSRVYYSFSRVYYSFYFRFLILQVLPARPVQSLLFKQVFKQIN